MHASNKFPAYVYQYHVDLFPADLQSGPHKKEPTLSSQKLSSCCTLAFQKKSE
jgi:hypothetical protein